VSEEATDVQVKEAKAELKLIKQVIIIFIIYLKPSF